MHDAARKRHNGAGASAHQPPQVVVLDDYLMIAEALTEALICEGLDARFVAPTDLDAVRQQLLSDPPDLVLLDLDLGGGRNGRSLVAPLVAAGVAVLVVTGCGGLPIAAALEAGAVGFHRKEDPLEHLMATVRNVLGHVPLDGGKRSALLTELSRARAERARKLAPFQRLTERERAVLTALGCGHNAEQIASSWRVAESTVRSHIRGLLVKLDAHSQLDAVATALRAGWLTAPPGASQPPRLSRHHVCGQLPADREGRSSLPPTTRSLERLPTR